MKRVAIFGIFLANIGLAATPCPPANLRIDGVAASGPEVAGCGNEVGDCEHSRAVHKKIQEYLQKAFDLRGDISLELRVQRALAFATDARDGKSGDILLRDAEYYLHGLYAATAKDMGHGVAVVGGPLYGVMKWAAWKLRDNGYPGLEKFMRTDPDQPTSQPGGYGWAYLGLQAGALLDGAREIPKSNVPPTLLPDIGACVSGGGPTAPPLLQP